MGRPTRLIAILVVIGLAGVSALLLLAHRLESRTTEKSVRDLPVKVDGPAAPDAESAGGADGAGGVARLAPNLVEAFIAVRKAEAEVLAKHPKKSKRLEAALTGNYDMVKGQRMSNEADIVQNFKMARDLTLQKSGLTEADYERTRDAWRAWTKGGTVTPELAAALEARRADLEKAGLGGLEILDDKIK